MVSFAFYFKVVHFRVNTRWVCNSSSPAATLGAHFACYDTSEATRGDWRGLTVVGGTAVQCPLHGPVVARDEMGNPRDPNVKVEPRVPDWQEPQLLRDLEAATGVQLRVGARTSRKRGQQARRSAAKVRARLEKKIFNR